MSSIEFGLVLPAQPGRGMTREIYLKRIREGLDIVTGHFHSIWYVDHVQFQDAPILEGWTALTYMAACYPSFHFGNVVLAQSFRHPALLAKMAATAQYMSEGRFILGIGTGWHQEEYDAYGFPYPTPGVRVEQLEETLTILKALWTLLKNEGFPDTTSLRLLVEEVLPRINARAPGRALRWRSCVDSRRSEVLVSFEPGRR
jgi:alkanesulfonate monooxygenase SsuD/methylene tetrahydromethanopterin reductase-like flavin-dependent oxidoreductase (luciferase family)